MSKVEKGKFVRMFGCPEVHLTACAVTKNIDTGFLLGLNKLANYFAEPNQFWQRDSRHEKALMKVYKRDLEESSICCDSVQTVKIPMLFLGHDSSDGWGELQFLIKNPNLVRLARRISFDTRVRQWVLETKPIQPKTDLGTHAYVSLRFYHQGYLPPVPGNWLFMPVYVSIRKSVFYKIDVFWEKEEIKITTTSIDKNSPEIPKHLSTDRQV